MKPIGDPEFADGIPPAPPRALAVFGSALPAIERYARMLAGPGVVRGLLGPREAARVWERHLLNCAILAEHVPAGASVCDVGSGAGLPGVVLALQRPDVTVVLLEPLLRRTTFLEEVVGELALTNARVMRGRAEDVARSLTVDVVTARAVAPLERLAVLCLPLVRPGGRLVALKGRTAESELAAARAALERLGVATARVVHVESASEPESDRTTVVILEKGVGRGPRAARLARRPDIVGPPV